MSLWRQVISILPPKLKSRLRTSKAVWAVSSGRFVSPEPEYASLSDWVHSGDWVIDVGANIGHYTLALSRLVGPAGRVVAFEPIPETFSVLTRCVERAGIKNVTLINAAATTEFGELAMNLPTDRSGMTNYYQASIGEGPHDGDCRQVLGFAIDDMRISQRVALIKIDAEGHDSSVLNGAWELIARDRPTLIVEDPDEAAKARLEGLGYTEIRNHGSPNAVYRPREMVQAHSA